MSLVLFGSGKRLKELRAGGRMASDRIEDALQWFSDRWPADATWPEGVTRPEPQAQPET